MILDLNKSNIAILASGNGSNAVNLIEHARSLNHEICLIITDNSNAGIIDKCKSLNTKCIVIPFIKGTSKSEHEEKIINELKAHDVNWILLAGYMKILSKEFLNIFYNNGTKVNNVINIHPSLLPSFPGRTGYEDAFKANVSESGITIHYVDSGIDTGPIIIQRSFPRFKTDSLQEFKARGLKIEHDIYKIVLENIIKNQISP